MLHVQEVEGKGRGLFTREKIAAGTLIARDSVVVVPVKETKALSKTILRNYTFAWGPDGEESAIALGIGSFCNHSYTPNTQYYHEEEERMVCYEALRDIEAGEEITVNYNGDPSDPSPIWFEPAETIPACT